MTIMGQTLKLSDRNNLEMNNAKKVISFNTNEFLVDTPYGVLKILGKDLSIGKMDTEKQELVIKGNIDSISYVNTKNELNKQKESIFKKIFK
ncbi:MAG: YabP/YqfC family sporulation protein [Erysipelotrichaceae bacterium]|nr:YabP/YqfC family sporulation protein [Erysipelotrichaceae bacterium]